MLLLASSTDKDDKLVNHIFQLWIIHVQFQVASWHKDFCRQKHVIFGHKPSITKAGFSGGMTLTKISWLLFSFLAGLFLIMRYQIMILLEQEKSKT